MPKQPILLLGRLLTAVAQDTRVTTTAAGLTSLGVRGEQWCRRAFGVHLISDRRHRKELEQAPRALGDRRPVIASVNWHEGGAGPAIVLLNGFSASGLMWPEDWIADLEKDHRVIRIDNRGTGWSRRARSPFLVGDLADDVHEVLRACGVDRATVLGHSMGGMIAQEFAVRYPAQVERLILVSTIPPLPAFAAADDYSRVLGLMVRGGIRGLVSRSAEDRGAPMLAFASEGFSERPGIAVELGRQILAKPTSMWALLHQVRALSSWTGPDRLATITAPTTVIHGADDPIVAPENGRRLAQLIPGADHIELPAVGHLVPWEAPNRIHPLLKD